MKRLIIVHGYTGNPDKNWFPWLKTEVQNRGVKVDIPAMPHSDAPILDEWLAYLHSIVSKPSAELFLVGHSLGCPTILRYLEAMDEGEVVGGVILVAGFAETLPHLPQLDSFTSGSWDDGKIIRHAEQIRLISSDNDQNVPYAMSQSLSVRLGAQLSTIPNGGHINEKSGYTQVPFVLDALREAGLFGD